MAEDEVIISNVGKDGVASEVTLQRLVSAFEKAKSLDTKGKKNLEALAKAAKDSTGKFKTFSDEIEKTTTIMEDVGKVLKKTFTIENFGKALGAAAGVTTNFVKELATGGDELGDFAQHIPIIGGSLGMLTGFLQDSLDTFRSLSDVGAGFGNDLLELRKVAASAGLPLDMFGSLVLQNADNMRLLGNTTSQGATVFAKLAKDMRSGDIGRRLLNMGFTTEELTEGLGNYIDLQARLGRAGQMSNAQLVQGSQTYLTELDRLARVTGQSRKALQEEISAMAAKSNLQALADAIGGTGGENFLAGMAAARKMLPGFGDALEDLADGVAQTPLAKKLASLSPAVADAAAAFGRGEITQNEFFDSLKNVGGPSLLEVVDGFDATTRSLLLQQEGFSELLGSVHEMRKFVDMEFDPAEAAKEQAKRNRINDGLSTFQDSLMKVRQEFVDLFVESGMAAKLSELLVTFSEQLLSSTQYFADMLTKFSEDPFGAIFEMLGDGLGKVWENKGLVGGIVAGIGALFAAKAVTGALAGAFKSAIGGTVSNIAGKIFSGGDAAGGGSTPKAPKGKPGAAGGRAGAQIGNFVGQMGAGVMKGAAAGLKAFANPQILIGAGILGGAITAVGAGIAGAAWLLGKSLPTFVDGLKSFEDIDGNALISAATGMLALSAAMAAFGAGSAVAGLGAMVGGITGAIGKLFGADDPLEQLKTFAAANIDGAKVKNNADAMVAFSKAMAAAGGASAAEGLGSLVSGIAGGIGSLFGGKDNNDIFADMVKFASYDIDTAKVKTNAEAMVAFSTAMALASGSNAVDGLGTLVSGIAGGIGKLFGGKDNNDIFADMVKFASYDIDTAKVKTNAEAMVAFSTAMNVASQSSAGEGLGTLVSGIAGGIGKLFGAEDPLTQLTKFSVLELDTARIKTNAEAMSAFSTAMSSVTMMPEKGIFASIGSAISGFLGVNTPFDQLIAFGALNIDNAKVKSNAEAMASFSAAMSGVVMMPEKGIFSSFSSAISGLFGTDTPFDQLKAFGALDLNAKNVKTNAEAMSSMSTALSTFTDIEGVTIDAYLAQRLTALAEVPDLTTFATSINALSNVSIATGVNALNTLDNSSVIQYTESMTQLVNVLSELNDELSKDNKVGLGTGTNAGDVLGKMDSIGGGGGGGSQMNAEQLNRLNTTLDAVKMILMENRDYNKDTAKALKGGDLQLGLD